MMLAYLYADEETPLTESQNGIIFVRKGWEEKENVKLQNLQYTFNVYISDQLFYVMCQTNQFEYPF